MADQNDKGAQDQYGSDNTQETSAAPSNGPVRRLNRMSAVIGETTQTRLKQIAQANAARQTPTDPSPADIARNRADALASLEGKTSVKTAPARESRIGSALNRLRSLTRKKTEFRGSINPSTADIAKNRADALAQLEGKTPLKAEPSHARPAEIAKWRNERVASFAAQNNGAIHPFVSSSAKYWAVPSEPSPAKPGAGQTSRWSASTVGSRDSTLSSASTTFEQSTAGQSSRWSASTTSSTNSRYSNSNRASDSSFTGTDRSSNLSGRYSTRSEAGDVAVIGQAVVARAVAPGSVKMVDVRGDRSGKQVTASLAGEKLSGAGNEGGASSQDSPSSKARRLDARSRAADRVR